MTHLSSRPATIGIGLLFGVWHAGTAPAINGATYYVPIVNVRSGTIEYVCREPVQSAWFNSIEAFNPSQEAVSIRSVDLFGDRSAELCLLAKDTLPPGANRVLRAPHFPGICVEYGVGPAFLVLNTDHPIALSSELALVEYRPPPPIKPPNSSLVSHLARVRVPVYEALFPANTTAVSKAVWLTPTGIGIGTGWQHRVNVTLFNPSETSATFVISAAGWGDEVTYSDSIIVPPLQVIQVNDIATNGGLVWITVSSTAPYLCYASAVIEDPGNTPPVTIDVVPFQELR